MSHHSSRRSCGRRAVVDLLESRTLFAITFADLAKYPVGGNTFAQPALADFNGDGFLDAATCSNQTGDNLVSVVLNQGNGTFGAASTLSVGGRPFQVIAGDFNGDTKQDLACTNVVDATVSVLLGNGDGTFQPRVDSTFGTPPPIGIGAVGFLTAVELNNDGKLDLFVNNNGGVKLATLLGNGDGTFVKQDEVVGNFNTLAVADFNGDTHPDVASNTGNDQALIVYFTDGAGNLDAGHTFPFVSGIAGFFSAEGTAAGDFNNDGKADVAMTTLALSGGLNAPSDLGVYLGNGDGTFQANVNTPLTNGSLYISVADLDNDGKLDAVVQGTFGFAALRGNGDGTFATPPESTDATFDSDGTATIGDVNSDGKPDLAFAVSGSDTDSLGVFLAGTPGGGGGGGGGGEGTTTVTPTVQATLPPAVVAGAKVKGAKVSVLVANDGTADLNAPVSVQLFVSTDQVLDDGDVAVGPAVVKKLKVKAAASKAVKLKVATLPTVPDGDYYLIAETSATGATGGTNASSNTVNIAAPFVDLSGAFGALPAEAIVGRKGLVPLTITNSGNVNATSSINIALVGRPATAGDDVPIPTTPIKINLKPGASKTFKLKITVPDTLEPGLTYSLGATVDSPGELTEKDESNNLVWSVSTILVLQGASA